MARKAKSMKANSFPVYVWLKSPNPYGNKVKVCGIEITTSKKIIEKPETLALFKSIQAFLNIESANVDVTPEVVETPKDKVEETNAEGRISVTENV